MSQLIIKAIGNTLNALSYLSKPLAAQKALSLFSTPRKGRYTDQKPNLFTAHQVQPFTVNNLNIATYHIKGNNSTVLLVHGWESNASRWHYMINDLKAKDYNIIIIDAPAHGKSDGKTFNAILYAQCITKVALHCNPEIIMGHSVGGMASIFALHFNTLPSVTTLVSLGAPAHFTGVFDRYKAMMGFNQRVSSGLDAIVKARFNNNVGYFSAADFAKQQQVNTLIVHDKRDKIIPFTDGELLAKCFKNSELMVTEGFGHSLLDTSITNTILKFIES